jgi:hypothetical protein
VYVALCLVLNISMDVIKGFAHFVSAYFSHLQTPLIRLYSRSFSVCNTTSEEKTFMTNYITKVEE